MARIVLVHGIAQEQKSADTLEAEWLPSLAGGVRLAGDPALADELWRDARPGAARMAFYGDLFRRDGQQGGADELTAEEWGLAGALAAEWLRNAASSAAREADRARAQAELARLTADRGEEQGVRAAARPVLNALVRLRPFARLGVAFAERVVVKALKQVTLYLTDETIRNRVQDRVAEHIGPETEVIIGHSLGSVVAYEAAHLHGRPLPLLLTLGSPLGLRTVVYERTRPQPPSVPPGVARWVNLADRDDLVAARPDLTPLFPGADGVLDSGYIVDNGAKPHEAAFYLAKRRTGEVLSAALR
ncbi:hypothetical protein [Amycolatopsis regifaucium]|uniref:Serine peptidase n=1 Tax=Amycolatopsis regifaucium TaxID=546365 RepID=A0A154M8N6_9PSEU|nr:hypothetical protein [Amycolatopsis regifaucium]KZB80720.1 hypothetical protein AVL48_12210 [Amycolatopsis regifaucium]OKA07743.1 hypothetical protein ATP06_0218235 [Amycolatopsis regifaucium]SFH03740.1 hypothetical protein SAMN04489731_102162 [Amycolatopsis regifaucium]